MPLQIRLSQALSADAFMTREAAIGHHAAALQAAIEDLTEDTIGARQPTPFPDEA